MSRTRILVSVPGSAGCSLGGAVELPTEAASSWSDHHFWGSVLFRPYPTGNTRHVDLLWPLWNLLDLTPEGRGTDWYPQLEYADRPV